jgi:signal-transduction protein with cAMP-binding, CBS, and nucleotidyltransferase domain
MGSIQVDDVEKKDAILRLCPFRPVDQVVGHLNLSEQKKKFALTSLRQQRRMYSTLTKATYRPVIITKF